MIRNRKGLTLIEVIISLSLLSLVLVTFFTCGLFALNQHLQQSKQLRADRNLRISVDLIEKRLREMDRQQIEYKPSSQVFEARMNIPNSSLKADVRVDLSGKSSSNHNTWIYFDRASGSLRTNKAGEHNVQIPGIENIDVNEVITGQLFLITLTGAETPQPQTLVFHIPQKAGEEEAP
ncbi:MAG: prepilin-type N-terminal cleavage/methylation domain-containing protein [Bacillota bacterium]|nr:prepilin-type N-terminal cleavage/methylation domain-containing protein [Bacillota bacterium]MDW7677218.1 prepilin-type N-terminal cleavage/methylation domain-containing protein [Bacillota bacterium]